MKNINYLHDWDKRLAELGWVLDRWSNWTNEIEGKKYRIKNEDKVIRIERKSNNSWVNINTGKPLYKSKIAKIDDVLNTFKLINNIDIDK